MMLTHEKLPRGRSSTITLSENGGSGIAVFLDLAPAQNKMRYGITMVIVHN